MSAPIQSKSIALITILALILLLGGGYLFNQNAQLRQNLVDRDKAFTELQDIHNELDSQFMEAQAKLEGLLSDNEELNQVIEQQIKELAQQKNRIAGLIKTNQNYDKARAEIAELTARVEQYVAEIAQLKDENLQLSDENLSLRDQTAHLTASVDMAREENAFLVANREQLTMEKENLSKTNTALTKKVDQASSIQVDKIQIRGMAVRESGKEVKKRKAKKIEKLNICFDTEVNPFAESGQETFYIRVINPNGETIAVESAGAGIMNLTENDSQIPYSTKTAINYNQQATEACIDWNPEIPFVDGVYAIEVYNKGFLTGHSTFNLK